jgi:hypothetical protein
VRTVDNKTNPKIYTPPGWTVSYVKSGSTDKSEVKVFDLQYGIQRSVANRYLNEVDRISIHYSSENKNIVFTRCSLEITYKDSILSENAPVTIKLPNVWEQISQPNGSVNKGTINFSNIPTGDEVIGGNYIQDHISIFIAANQSFDLNTINVNLKDTDTRSSII